MDKKKPLTSLKSHASVLNRSGRPKNDNLIKFGPQPKSLVSQMLKNEKKSSHLDISINSTNTSPEKCKVVDNNCDALTSSIQIALGPDVDVANITNKIKDSKNQLHSCDFPNCKYVCKLSSNLVKHKRTHTSEKPYLCHLCTFRSNFINSLKVHQRIHTAERPYSCNYCSYRCNSSSNLKKHCKHKHNSIPKPEQELINDSET